jgi:CHAT domain-containing protein/Tfp pilus assembly protein PilF
MTLTPEVQQRIRQYLLGQLSDDVREQVEKDLVTDDEIYQELLIAEDEMVDEYLDGKLTESDRLAFETHFLATPDRQESFKFGRAFRRYVTGQGDKLAPEISRPKPAHTPKPWHLSRAFFSSPLAIAACALLLVALGFGIWRVFIRQSPVDQGLIALNLAYRDQRPLESRISSLSYAPFETRGGPDRTDSLALRRAEAILSDPALDASNPATHHALGEVYLAKKQLDEAIKEFDEALKSDQKNARLYSDLGAAWLEKGKEESERNEQGKAAAGFARSFDNLKKAIDLDDNLLPARFNRALCYQLMLLPLQAEAEWREYLKRDPSSPWANEAKNKLKQLEDRKHQTSDSEEKLLPEFRAAFQRADDATAWEIVSQHRDFSGGPITNALIDNYLDLSAKGQRDQSWQALKELSYVARLEKQRAGDHFVQDLVQQLSISTGQRLASWIEARQLLKLGQDQLIQANSAAAFQSLDKAKTIFELVGATSEAVFVQYPIGHSYLGQKQSDLGLATFDQVVRLAEAHQYKWLMAQALNATANTQIGLTNHSAAIEASERSLLLSKEIGDTTGVIKTTSQLASEYFRLGNYAKSLELHQQSLTAANITTPEPMQLWRNYSTIAQPLEALGLHAAAIEYEKEALRRAEAMKRAVEISRSHSVLGLLYAGKGNYQEAMRSGEAAIGVAGTIPGERDRQEALAYSMLQLALIYRESGDPGRAIENYDKAITGYRNLDNFGAFSYIAHKGKLLTCIDQPGCGFAADEIKTCMDLFQQYRSNIREASNRLPFFDTEQTIYDIATEYAFAQHNYEQSFEYSEQGRAGVLRELAENKARLIENSSGPDIQLDVPVPVKSFSELQAGIPANAQILQYVVLRDKLIIWLISKTTFVHEEKSVALADLDEITHRYLTTVSSPSTNLIDVARDGSALYEILIRPIERELAKDKLLCIVPDKALNYLPFGALVSAPGKYLIDDFKIIMAASATMFVTSSANASQKQNVQNESLLSVGNPRFDRVKFPQLADLPSAENEARQIKRFYDQSRASLLIDDEAVKSRVTAEMKKADVVHLALHSVVDEQSPFRSQLILAGGGSRDGSNNAGALPAYEIYAAGTPVTRLVVLSACDTGLGRFYNGEGITGLSQTFIAAGVPLVVATLWSVESDATAKLMIEFHRLRKNDNLPTVEALRKAQQHLAHDGNSEHAKPYYWAGFTVNGGYATF